MTSRLRITDWDMNAVEASQADIAVGVVSHKDILQGPTYIQRKLSAITDDPERAWSLRHRMAFMVEGYDDDARELYEIPEVCTFFRVLTAQWPYWWHFLTAQPGFAQYQLIESLLVGVVRRHTSSDLIQVERVSSAHVINVRKRLAAGVTALYQRHGWAASVLHDCLTTAELCLSAPTE
jgi:hypothetical protein